MYVKQFASEEWREASHLAFLHNHIISLNFCIFIYSVFLPVVHRSCWRCQWKAFGL